MTKKLSILINSFACGPDWGSEVGMGWHWIISLSNYCQLFVITEKGFKKDIEKVINNIDLKFFPNFYYVDIGHEGRKLFWRLKSP